jgi:hypothetical protein
VPLRAELPTLTPRGTGDPRANVPLRSQCSIEGCQRKRYSQGWRGMHHARCRRHGDPLVSNAGSGFGYLSAWLVPKRRVGDDGGGGS